MAPQTTDPRIDAYIEKAAAFAQPILRHIRKIVTATCPDVEETIKWGFPHFDYKGMMCSMAAFKSHCAFNFWKSELLTINHKPDEPFEKAMGQFGRITTLKDLPSDAALVKLIKAAMKLNDAGIASPARAKKAAAKPAATALTVPDYFLAAIAKNKQALATFEGFSYSNKKEYVEWIVNAKTEATRQTRLATAIDWMAAGKIRNWKYIRQ